VISLGWKWCQTVLGTEVSFNQWEGSACTQSALFFSFKFGGGGGRWGGEEDLFHFSFVHNRFPMCSARVFPKAPCFNPLRVWTPCLIHRCVPPRMPPRCFSNPLTLGLYRSVESSKIWHGAFCFTEWTILKEWNALWPWKLN
jgi:hypothetical protein